MRAGFYKDHKDVGDRTVGDPGFAAGDAITRLMFLGLAAHRLRIGACIGFGEAKTADPFASREIWQIFSALFLAAIGVDRVHHE